MPEKRVVPFVVGIERAERLLVGAARRRRLGQVVVRPPEGEGREAEARVDVERAAQRRDRVGARPVGELDETANEVALCVQGVVGEELGRSGSARVGRGPGVLSSRRLVAP